jgi:hypothetical protein
MTNRKIHAATDCYRQFDAAIQQATCTVQSADDFLQWIRDHWSLLTQRGHANRQWMGSLRQPVTQLVSLTWRAHKSIHANTHSCPRGGVTNWSQVLDRPRGYLGWRGYMEWEYTGADPRHCCGSDMFRDSVINTGTGGGGGGAGGGQFGFDVLLWADDWPAWRLADEQREMWKILKSS